MEEDWEQIADGPAIIPKKVAVLNKWDGEDEEEDIKDSWEDEENNDDEEKKDDEKLETTVVKTKPKKSLQEKIAEKERLRAEEEEARIREMEENMTPEEKMAHKIKLQKIQEESDLKVAMETLGLTSTDIITTGSIDEMNPTNTVELNELGNVIIKKINNYKSIEDFSSVVEEMIRNLCANLNVNDLQKIKKTLDTIYLEKQKLEKEKNKKGGAAKGKGRAKLRLDNDRAPINEYYNDSYADNFDDFM